MPGQSTADAPAPSGLVETRLGALFVEITLAPLALAAGRFAQSMLATGLADLEPKKLAAGLDAALAQVARRAAVSPGVVERLVPGQELRAVLVALEATQRDAFKAISRYEATMVRLGSRQIPGDPPSPSVVLAQLAQLFVRDKHIASPLRKVAADIARFEQLVAQGGRRLDASSSLRSLYRRRQLRLAALGCFLVALLAGLPVYLAWARHLEQARLARAAFAKAEADRARGWAQMRVETLLALGDACAGGALPEGDAEQATAEQRGRLEARAGRCAAQQAQEAARARCASLLAHLEAGQFGPDDEAAAGRAGALVGRITRRALLPSDLLAADGDLPCQDAPAAPRYWEAFARAALAAPQVWGAATGVSDRVVALLSDRSAAFSDPAQRSISFRAEDLAKRALRSGQPDALRGAKSYCVLKGAIGLSLGLPCLGIMKKA